MFANIYLSAKFLAMVDHKKSDITTSLYLDRRRQKKKGNYPVKLRVTYLRKSRFYGTAYSLSEDEFANAYLQKPTESYKDLHRDLIAIETKARRVIDTLDGFTFEKFKVKFERRQVEPGNLFAAFNDYIAELRENGRIGNAIAYECALHSLKEFYPSSSLPFREISPAFLHKYQKWMTDADKSLTTVGIYLRCVRCLFNMAVKNGTIEKNHYPFGLEKDHLYTIPAPQNIKKALKLADIKKISDYKAIDGSREELFRDLWMFSYICNGINIKDICLLKYADIKDQSLIFRRAKTSNTNKKNKQITAAKTQRITDIIEKWGMKPSPNEQYIFQFLQKGLTPDQEKAEIRQVVKMINKYIKRIAIKVGITTHISVMTARHSFATVLKRSGVNISYISEALGHTDVKTTESYLDSFESDEQMKIATKLTDW